MNSPMPPLLTENYLLLVCVFEGASLKPPSADALYYVPQQGSKAARDICQFRIERILQDQFVNVPHQMY